MVSRLTVKEKIEQQEWVSSLRASKGRIADYVALLRTLPAADAGGTFLALVEGYRLLDLLRSLSPSLAAMPADSLVGSYDCLRRAENCLDQLLVVLCCALPILVGMPGVGPALFTGEILSLGIQLGDLEALIACELALAIPSRSVGEDRWVAPKARTEVSQPSVFSGSSVAAGKAVQPLAREVLLADVDMGDSTPTICH